MVAAASGRARAEATPRIALVIGNQDYASVNLPPLGNPASDAKKVAAELSRLGFAVDLRKDLDRAALGEAMTMFGARLRDGHDNPIVFVYYSGHAAQDEFGINYLLPVNASARTPQEVRAEGVQLQALLNDLDAANNNVNVVVLDACRDWFKDVRSGGMPRGLHDTGRIGSVLIATATLPGSTAEDGGEDGSPYARRLVEALRDQAGDPVALLFGDVDSRVYSDTASAQQPVFLDGMVRAPRWSLQAASPPKIGSLRPPASAKFSSAFLDGLDRARILALTRENVAFTETLFSRRDLLAKAQINTPLRLAYFLESIDAETGFRSLEEQFGYSASGLALQFPSRFPNEEAARPYERRPTLIANVIYANRLGNGDEASGDGWRYRGRGLFGFTGRGNYGSLARLTGVDLVNAPDLMTDPEVGLAAAAAFWESRGINRSADADDLAAVTRALIGGPLRMDVRRALLQRAKAAVAPTAQ